MPTVIGILVPLALIAFFMRQAKELDDHQEETRAGLNEKYGTIPEPFAYMSAKNYRGIRSPREMAVLASVFTVLAGAMLYAVTAAGPGERVVASVFFVVVGSFAAFIWYMTYKRFHWMHEVGMSTRYPLISDRTAWWGRLSGPGQEHVTHWPETLLYIGLGLMIAAAIVVIANLL